MTARAQQRVVYATPSIGSHGAPLLFVHHPHVLQTQPFDVQCASHAPATVATGARPACCSLSGSERVCKFALFPYLIRFRLLMALPTPLFHACQRDKNSVVLSMYICAAGCPCLPGELAPTRVLKTINLRHMRSLFTLSLRRWRGLRKRRIRICQQP